MKQNEIARKRYVARERTRSHGADETSPDHIQRFPMMQLRHAIRNSLITIARVSSGSIHLVR